MSQTPVAQTEEPGWAEREAFVHLSYLQRCSTEPQQIAYLAAALRLAESAGARRGVEQLAEALAKQGIIGIQ